MSTLANQKLQQSDLASGLTLTGCELAGLALNNLGQVTLNSGNNIHGCKITGNTRLVLASGAAANKIVWNDFAGNVSYPVSGNGIGDNNIVEYNLVDMTGVPTGTGDNKGSEFLHFIGRCNGTSVSYNIITTGLARWAFEIQDGETNLKVVSNYIRVLQGGSGLSLAIGGKATAPFANAGEHALISGNVVLCSLIAGQNAALEIDGDLDIHVTGNYFSGFQTGIVNGTGGQAGQGLFTDSNVIAYTVRAYSDGDNTPWIVPPRTSVGDKLYKIGVDGGIPNLPPAPTNVGAANDPANSQAALDSSTGATVAQADLIAGITSTTNSLTITLKSAPVTSASIQYKSLHGTDASLSVPIPVGSTVVEIDKLSASWDYALTIAVDGATQTASPQCQVQGDTIGKSPNGTPATPAPVVSAPTVDLAALKADWQTKAAAADAAELAYVTALELGQAGK